MKKIPVIICATTARLPALLQAFNNKFLFTIEDSCKDATNLIKILRQVKDHHQLLLLLDSEIALRNNGQLPEHLYRNFAA
ncbi:MAG: hypothetical protein J7497_16295, partial [Chitinophagaceae bacterium]|nr:hypothetical protein [Chitinophagaceae bacterium]